MKKFLIILFVVLAEVCAGQNPQWIEYNTQNSGLPRNVIYSIAIEKRGGEEIIWIGTIGGLTKFDGANWITFDTSNSKLPNNFVTAIAIDEQFNKWICTYDGGLAKFDGINWNVYDTNNSGIQTNRLYCMDIDSNNIKWIGTYGKGLISYDDVFWNNYDTSNSNIPQNYIQCIDIESNTKWLGTINQGVGKLYDTLWTIFNSTNSGLSYDWIKNIFIDEGRNKWICTQFGGLCNFNSTQNLWTVYNVNNSGIPTNNTLCLVTDKNDIKWIGTLGGGLSRYDGLSWETYNIQNSPLPSDGIVSHIGLDSSNNLWMGTNGGLFLFNESGIVNIQKNSAEISKNFHLSQNYPNPFNSNTVIKYSIVSRTQVNLAVFNVLGEKVTTKINEIQNAGEYSIQFDAKDLSSGIYYYKIVIGGNQYDVKKMLLIK